MFQVLIIITGNYTFFNILTIAIMIPVWEDDFSNNLSDPFDSLSGLISWYGKSIQLPSNSYWGRVLLRSATWAFIAWSATKFIDFNEREYSPWWTGNHIRWKLKWRHLSPYMLDCCIFAYLMVFTHVVYFTLLSTTFHRRRITALRELILGLVSILWISLSATQLRGLTNNQVVLPPPLGAFMLKLESEWSSFRLVSSYGLFRHMTGVSNLQGQYKDSTNNYIPALVGRPELIIEGLDTFSNEWKEINFLNKPGDIFTTPSIVAPHQPRLDWQMWFAALGSYQRNPWLVHLVYKLVEQHPTNSTVLHLLDRSSYPFLDSKPAAIRISKYNYDFTRLNSPWIKSTPFVKIIDNAHGPTAWYSRTGGDEYLPAIESGNPSILEYLKTYGLESRRTKRPKSRQILYRDCLKRNDGSEQWSAFFQRLCCKSLLLLEVVLPRNVDR